MDLELERVFQGIANRSKRKAEKMPEPKPRVLRKAGAVCLKHEQIDWNCQPCRTQYDRERRHRKAKKS